MNKTNCCTHYLVKDYTLAWDIVDFLDYQIAVGIEVGVEIRGAYRSKLTSEQMEKHQDRKVLKEIYNTGW